LIINNQIASEGWYAPPPNGISVLIDADPPYSRLNYSSLRDEQYWPSDKIIGKESVTIAYASPVDRESLIIGDFGATFYFGDSPDIRYHINQCENILLEFAQTLREG